MPALIDLTGQRFGRLAVLQRGPNKGGNVRWHCACDCGMRCVAYGSALRNGLQASCGCLRSEVSAARATHGMSGTPIYLVWQAMLNRCYRTKQASYRNYGARGIRVCAEWHRFAAFYADMGPGYRPGLSIDRIDTDGHYAAENCRWADRRTQANNRRNNRRVVVNGQAVTATEAARAHGLSPNVVAQRLLRGWPDGAAVALPLGSRIAGHAHGGTGAVEAASGG